MTRLLAVALGVVAAAWLWRALRPTFTTELFQRQNFRGASVPVGVGVVLALSALAGEAALGTLAALGVEDLGDSAFARLAVLVTAVGFGLLGLVDDVGATGDDRGFRGHLLALRRGRLTTGSLKLLGGGLLSVAVVASVNPDEPARWLVGSALVALSANLGNLFDRAPGRTAKVGLVAGIVLVAVHPSDALLGLLVVLGATAALLVGDLREELMLGDAGANTLGGCVGLGVVLTCSLPTQVVVLAVVGALNLASEVVSFSRVIDATGPLRFLDQLGRRSD